MTELVATCVIINSFNHFMFGLQRKGFNIVSTRCNIYYIIFFLVVIISFSDGYMSSVVTYIAALKGVITLTRALIYVIAQFIGSIIEFIMLKYAIDPMLKQKYSPEGCAISDVKEPKPKPLFTFLVEFLPIFFMLFAAVTFRFDKKWSKESALPIVCIVIAGLFAIAVYASIFYSWQFDYANVRDNQ
ncbi:Putative aquaporin [Arachis hypogaea]|nr:Putative aquaporin [Arachis hypogaea]